MKVLALFALLLLPALGSAQFPDWLVQTRNSGHEYMTAVDMDATNRTYALGYQAQGALQLEFFPPLSYVATERTFVTCIDPAGTPAWLSHITPTSGHPLARVRGQDIAVDSSGNQYVIGNFIYSATFDGDTLIDTSSNAVDDYRTFLTKITPDGQREWFKAFSSPDQTPNQGLRIEVGNNGDLIISGLYCSSILMDTLLLEGDTSCVPSGYLACFSPQGDIKWAKQVIRTYNSALTPRSRLNVIKLDQAGNIYWRILAGYQSVFGNDTLNDTDLLVKIRPDGHLLWYQPVHEDLQLMAAHDRLYGVLSFMGTETYNGTTYTATPGGGDVLLIGLDTAGTTEWVHHVPSDGHTVPRAMAASADGAYFTTYYVAADSVPYPGGFTIPAQSSGYAAVGYSVAKMDTAGLIQWMHLFNGPNSVFSSIACATDGSSLSFVGETSPFPWGNSNPISGHNGFCANMATNTTEINGVVFRDLNNDGTQDVGEAGIAATVQAQPGPGYFSGFNTGFYRLFASPGSHSVSLSNPPIYHTVNPGSHTVSINGIGGVNAGNDFACVPLAGVQDLEVIATALTPIARPGRDFTVQLVVDNHGSVAVSDTLSVTFDTTQMGFDSSSVAPAIASGPTLQWPLTLPAWTNQTLQINFLIDSTAVIGDTISYLVLMAPLAGDTTPINNADSAKHPVSTSYDPNDKQVFPASDLTPQQVADEPWLTYLVRFQNTGTDTAFVVVIRDTLDTDLNHASLEFLDASHPYTTDFRNGALTISFNNILLPDSNVNEPLSHGFIKYRIKPKTNLSIGDQITNTAHIYFDFNAPIVTNTTVTEIAEPVSVPINAATLSSEILVFPNPGNGTFQIQASGLGNGPVILAVYDLTGRMILQGQFPNSDALVSQPHQLHGPAGIYLIRVAQEGQEPAFIRYIHR